MRRGVIRLVRVKNIFVSSCVVSRKSRKIFKLYDRLSSCLGYSDLSKFIIISPLSSCCCYSVYRLQLSRCPASFHHIHSIHIVRSASIYFPSFPTSFLLSAFHAQRYMHTVSPNCRCHPFVRIQADTSLRSVSSCRCLLSPLRGSVSVLAQAGPCCLRRAHVSTRVNPDSVTDELSYFVI